MKDVFLLIDDWKSPFNMFKDAAYFRRVAKYSVAVMAVLWLVLGFDSGVAMLELWSGGWGVNYAAYGESLHFSSIVIYGLLFIWSSSHLEKLGIVKSKNVVYSIAFVFLNISVFEWCYMVSFAHFQMHRDLWQWFVNDLFFLQQYIGIFVMGVLAALSFYLDSFVLFNRKTVGRAFRFFLDYKTVFWVLLAVGSFLLWVYYPLPVESISFNGWVNSSLFPQTNYAYVNSDLYVEDNLLHALNVFVKYCFVFVQVYVLRGFKSVLCELKPKGVFGV